MSDKDFRIEHDSMGELKVPATARWGAQTQRAVENFPISGLPMPRGFIRALGLVKWAAAGANAELGLMKSDLAAAIQKAALEAHGVDYSLHGTRDEGSVYLRDPDDILVEITTGY